MKVPVEKKLVNSADTLKMLHFLLIFTTCATLVKTQEGEIIIPDNKTVCINDMVEWCNQMQYPQQGAGLAALSIVYEDPNGYYRVLCTSDSDGTNCTRNTSPWFTCSPDHVLVYKGQVITNETAKENVDDDICDTADKAFNEIYVQNLSYKNISLQNEVQEGMEAFFDQIALMQEQIDLIRKFLRSLPYIGDIWGIIEEEYGEREFEEPMPTTAANDNNQTTTDNNQTTTENNQTITDNTQTITDKVNEIEKE